MGNDVFNQLCSFEGKKVILAGWKASGILDALERGLAGFSGSFINSYYGIDLLIKVKCISTLHQK